MSTLLPSLAQNSGDLQVQISQQKPVRISATLQCGKGELLALVGPSGSGKSTVLRCIAGLHRADQASIQCAGETWDDAASGHRVQTQQRKVGLVFQEYALFPHKSALDNVVLATPGTSRKERVKKAMVLLERTNMTGLEHRMPHALSGGQKQRVALARALAREPRVLLLDEPFSAVDQQTRRKLYSELAALRHTLELPIILVTHDLTEVQLLADTLCLMHKGISLHQGAVADVINRPLTREIARLVGHQNLFNIVVTAQEHEHTLYKLGDLDSFAGPKLTDARVGDQASLLISSSAIQVVVSEPSTATAYNNSAGLFTLNGTVQESVLLGDEVFIRLHLEKVPKSLRFKLPMHIAQAEGIVQGSALKINVHYHGIHVMAS